MKHVIEWLESPEGERWSFGRHVLHVDCNRVVALIMLKDDEDYEESLLWVA